jgi:hypothetical protein
LAAAGVSLRRQSGQFTCLLADPAAKIGQLSQHRRDPIVIPIHRRASHTLSIQTNAAGSAARDRPDLRRPPGRVTIRAFIFMSSGPIKRVRRTASCTWSPNVAWGDTTV